jgi:type IV secretion system protein VirB10
MLTYGSMKRPGLLVAAVFVLHAAAPDRDFSGKWVLDPARSDPGTLAGAPEPSLTISQDDRRIVCSSASGEARFDLHGGDSKYRLGEESRNSAVKWEGSALLINTLVASGSQQYAISDRWRLSDNGAMLHIGRQVNRGPAQTEGYMVYRREGVSPQAGDAAPLATRPAPAAPPALTVRQGTRILLRLVNSLDTRHSREGDRVYLETAVPVAVDNRIVIPRGSSVAGTITRAKQPGRTSGKGELYIRFDSLTLPNGTTRDFRSRLSGGDPERGTIDREEGKITGEGNRPDARTVAIGTGMGASIGSIAGAAAGHAGMGAGVGGIAGAAAGLAGVFSKHGPDAVLPKGTNVEMTLDRDLQYSPDDLR